VFAYLTQRYVVLLNFNLFQQNTTGTMERAEISKNRINPDINDGDFPSKAVICLKI
jgi:hypothetical protein